MPDLDAASAMQLPLPVWAVGALLVLLISICIMALRRSGSTGSVAALFGIPALIIIAWSAWTFVDHSIQREWSAERQALEVRALQLTASAMAPGSALACLDAGTGEVVEASCERAVFASPEVVAVAATYVEARLRLLADSLDYVRRVDHRKYQISFTGLRRAIEADRFGLVAQVLATRDGCTPEQCEAFALLRDASVVRGHLQARTYEKTVARYAANWTEQADLAPRAVAAPPAIATAPAAPLIPFVTVVTKPIDFPSAASIPPVSIMNAEPGATAAAAAEAGPRPTRPAAPPRTP